MESDCRARPWPRRCQARLLVAAHRQNRPFQVRERCEEGFEWGVIVRGQPATASGQAAGECTDAPNVRLASLGRSPVVYLHPADKYSRLTHRPSQGQKGIDERALMASQ